MAEPVSYTHLDVYKRQGKGGTAVHKQSRISFSLLKFDSLMIFGLIIYSEVFCCCINLNSREFIPLSDVGNIKSEITLLMFTCCVPWSHVTTTGICINSWRFRSAKTCPLATTCLLYTSRCV